MKAPSASAKPSSPPFPATGAGRLGRLLWLSGCTLALGGLFVLTPSCGISCETVRTCPVTGGAGGELPTGGTRASSGGRMAAGGEVSQVSGGAGSGIGGEGGDGSSGSGGRVSVDPRCAELVCEANAGCVLKGGSPTCACDAGFSDDDGTCVDIDECQDQPCGANETCENEPGTYACGCSAGFFEDLGACWPDMVLVSEGGAYSGAGAVVSADGRFVGFFAYPSDFGLAEDHPDQNVLYRDLRSGDSLRVASTSPTGETADGNGSFVGNSSVVNAVSGIWDRQVLFAMAASNLTTSPTPNGPMQIYLHTMGSDGSTVVSLGPNGPGNAFSFGASVSNDHKKVAFLSAAANLIDGDTNNLIDVYVRDLETMTTVRASTSSAGIEQTGTVTTVGCNEAQISGNGRYVAMRCDGTNLTVDGQNTNGDVFVKDLQTQELSRVSVSAYPNQPEAGNVRLLGISDDSDVVAFASFRPDLVADDTNGLDDVFVRIRSAGVTKRVSVRAAGIEANGASGASYPGGISGDGRYVVFMSDATNLVAGDTNEATDVFVRDLLTETTTRVSLGPDGQQADAQSDNASISKDGRFVLFSSYASNFGASGYNLWIRRILP